MNETVIIGLYSVLPKATYYIEATSLLIYKCFPIMAWNTMGGLALPTISTHVMKVLVTGKTFIFKLTRFFTILTWYFTRMKKSR